MEKGYLAVYSSSSDALAKEYFEAAWALGSEMAERGWSLVFGAGRVGLMGECARAHPCFSGAHQGVWSHPRGAEPARYPLRAL